MGVPRLWLISHVPILRDDLEFGLGWMQPAAHCASLPGCGIRKAGALGTWSWGIPPSLLAW